MSDAGISELSADPVAVLAKVEERFRLDLTDEMVSTSECTVLGRYVTPTDGEKAGTVRVLTEV